MPGNLPVPLGVEVKLIWGWQGAPYAINVLHFRNTPATPIDQIRANAIDTLIKGQYSGASSQGSVNHTGVTLIAVHTRDMRDNTNIEWVGAGSAVPGTATGDPLPAAVSFVQTLKTAKRGRSYQGRIYAWGFTEASNDVLGGVVAATQSAVATFWAGILSNMSSQQNMQQCVLSRFTTPPGASAPVERDPPELTTVTAIVQRDTRWDYQRRRAIPGI